MPSRTLINQPRSTYEEQLGDSIYLGATIASLTVGTCLGLTPSTCIYELPFISTSMECMIDSDSSTTPGWLFQGWPLSKNKGIRGKHFLSAVFMESFVSSLDFWWPSHGRHGYSVRDRYVFVWVRIVFSSFCPCILYTYIWVRPNFGNAKCKRNIGPSSSRCICVSNNLHWITPHGLVWIWIKRMHHLRL